MNPTTQPAELESPAGLTEPDPRDDVRGVGRFVRRRWKVIVAFALLGALVGGVRGALAGPTYEASATVLFAADPVSRIVGLPDDFLAEGDITQPGSVSQTRMLLIQQGLVASAVRRRLGNTESAGTLLGKIRVEQDGVSSLYRVIATDDTAAGAERLADVWATTFVQLRERAFDRRLTRALRVSRLELRRPGTSDGRKADLRALIERLELLRAGSSPGVEVVNEADRPTQPVGAGAVVTALAGLIVGLVLGTGVAVLLDQLSVRRRDGLAEPDGQA